MSVDYARSKSVPLPTSGFAQRQRRRWRAQRSRQRGEDEDAAEDDFNDVDLSEVDTAEEAAPSAFPSPESNVRMLNAARRHSARPAALRHGESFQRWQGSARAPCGALVPLNAAARSEHANMLARIGAGEFPQFIDDAMAECSASGSDSDSYIDCSSSSPASGTGSEDGRPSGNGSPTTTHSSAYECSEEDTGFAESDYDEGRVHDDNNDESDGADGDLDVSIDSEARDVVPRLPDSRTLGPIDECSTSAGIIGAEAVAGARKQFTRSAAQSRDGQRHRRRRTHAAGDSRQRIPSRRRTVFDDVISGKRRSTSGRRFQSVVLNGTTELEGPEMSGALGKQRSSSFMDDLLAPLQAWAAGGSDDSDDNISSEDDVARAARDAEHEAALEAAAAFVAERAHLMKEVEMTSFPQHGGTFMRDVRAHRRRMMCQRIALKGSSEGKGSSIFALHSTRCLLRDCIFEHNGVENDSGDAERFSFHEATLLIDRNAGTICEILLPSEMALLPDGCELEDVGDAVIMPGLVDPHVHLCNGRKRWEGFASGTQAAAAGGITTLIDMPTRCTPLTSSAELLEQKMAEASGNLWTDCGFYGGVGPENVDEVEGMLQAGAAGLVCYFTPPEPGTFAKPTNQETLAKLMELMADAQRTRHAPLLVSAGLYSEEQLALASPMRLEPPDERLNKKVSVSRLSRASGRASSASGRSSVTLSHSDLFVEPTTPRSPTLSSIPHSAVGAFPPTRRRRSVRTGSVKASPLHPSSDSMGENLDMSGASLDRPKSYGRSINVMDDLTYREDKSEPRQISDGTEDGGADGDEDDYWAMQSRDSRSPSPLVTPMGRRLHRSRRSAQRSNFNPRKKQAFAKNPLLNQLMKSELRRSGTHGHGHRLPGAADRRRVTLHEAGTRSQPLPGTGADRRRGHSLTEMTMGKHGLAQVNAAIWGHVVPGTRQERGVASNSPLTPGGLGAAAGDLRRSSSPPMARASPGASSSILSGASPNRRGTPSKGSPVLLPMKSPKSTLEHMRARGARISAPPPISMPPPAESASDSAHPRVLRGSQPDASRKKGRSRARDRFQQLLTAESGSATSDKTNPQGEGVSEQLSVCSTAPVANRMAVGGGRVSRGLALAASPASPGSPLRNELADSASSRPERRRRSSTRSESRVRRSQEDEDKHLATLRLRRAGLLMNNNSASGSGGPATAATLTIDSAYKDSDKLTRVALRGNYSVYLDHHPEVCEADGIEMLLGAMKQVGKRQPRRPGETDQQHGVANQGPCEWPDVKVHILQLSSALTIAALKRARRSGALLTVETCPHYLAINKDVIEDGDTRFKILPPIRDESNCTALWRALLNGSIDMVVSAHTPCPSHLKIPGDFQRAMGGLGSIQFALPLMWTQAQRKGFTEECVAQWMCFNPAKMLGLVGSKGSLEIGKDADIVVWDPKQRFEMNSKYLYMENKDTPFHRVPMMGVVLQTYVRGTRIFDARKGGIVEPDTSHKGGPGKILRL